jgi:hypothetical protein
MAQCATSLLYTALLYYRNAFHLLDKFAEEKVPIQSRNNFNTLRKKVALSGKIQGAPPRSVTGIVEMEGEWPLWYSLD